MSKPHSPDHLKHTLNGFIMKSEQETLTSETVEIQGRVSGTEVEGTLTLSVPREVWERLSINNRWTVNLEFEDNGVLTDKTRPHK